MESLYDLEAVKPMWEELVGIGFKTLSTPEQVDEVFANHSGTTLALINSVCGCAAGRARPGVAFGLQHSVIPDRMVTVFAGVDRAATQKLRGYLPPVAPSSPFVALFKDGEVVHVLERSQIEMMDTHEIAGSLHKAFDEHCTRQGPSLDPGEFQQRWQPEGAVCGSQVMRP